MPDIFISYAHLDNQPFSGEEKGWVTHLVDNLRNLVSRKAGRPEDGQLWVDFRIKGCDEITPEIERQLDDSYLLVVMMSSAWLASEWCSRELKIFSRHLAQAGGGVFLWLNLIVSARWRSLPFCVI